MFLFPNYRPSKRSRGGFVGGKKKKCIESTSGTPGQVWERLVRAGYGRLGPPAARARMPGVKSHSQPFTLTQKPAFFSVPRPAGGLVWPDGVKASSMECPGSGTRPTGATEQHRRSGTAADGRSRLAQRRTDEEKAASMQIPGSAYQAPPQSSYWMRKPM